MGQPYGNDGLIIAHPKYVFYCFTALLMIGYVATQMSWAVPIAYFAAAAFGLNLLTLVIIRLEWRYAKGRDNPLIPMLYVINMGTSLLGMLLNLAVLISCLVIVLSGIIMIMAP